MAKYTALTPIKHDGKHYATGASIDLSKDEARGLLAASAIEPERNDGAAAKQAEAERLAAEKAEVERRAAGADAANKPD